jgi:hypothetical protein
MSRHGPEEVGPREDSEPQPLRCLPGRPVAVAPQRSHMPKAVAAADDPEARARAEAQLQLLQKELTGTRTRPSFGAALERAAQRVDRRRQAASAPFAADARHLRSELRPEDVPLDLMYTQGRDEREDEPWFKQLPLEEQDRLRR